jgi:hypothetical protein
MSPPPPEDADTPADDPTPGDIPTPGERPAAPWWRQELVYGATLVGLCAMVIAQPLLDVFGRAPDVFLFRQATSADIVWFGVLVTFAPPLALWLASAPFRFLGSGPRRLVHVASVGVLLGAFGLLVVQELTGLGGMAAVLVSLTIGGAGAFAYLRVDVLELWASLLALAAPAFLGLFLVASPTAELFDQGGGFAAEAQDDCATVPADPDRPPVVVVLLDELPLRSLLDTEGGIDAELYPNLATFADDSVWYRNTTAEAGSTWYSVPSMLSGLTPTDDRAPLFTGHPDNLFTGLAGTYEMEGFEVLTRLCPPSLCEPVQITDAPAGLRPLLSDGRAIYRELLSPGERSTDPVTSYLEAFGAAPTPPGDGDADDTVAVGFGDFGVNQPARYTAFLDTLGQRPVPTLWYLHLLLPHEPWHFLPGGTSYAHPDLDHGRAVFHWSDQEVAVDVARQRHILQTMYSDGLLGGVMDRLRAEGLYDDAVIIVTSDHGVAFTPGEPVRGTSEDSVLDEIWPELLWVPLFVKAPGLDAGTVSDRNVLLVDLAPTLAELAGVTLPYETDGRSVVSDPARDDAAKPFARVEMSAFGNHLREFVDYPPQQGLDAALADSVGRFLPPDGGTPWRPYRLGPYGDLVGRPLSDFTVGSEGAGGVTLQFGAGLRSAQRGATTEALVSGHLDDAEGPAVVAVVVDGTLAGVTPTFDWTLGPHMFAVVVPEPLLDPDGVDLRLYQVEGDPLDDGAARFVPLSDGS